MTGCVSRAVHRAVGGRGRPTAVIAGSALVTLLVLSASVSATVIITWTPIYSGTAYVASPYTGAQSGGVTFGVPPSFNLVTGVATMNYTATSTGAPTAYQGAWTVSGAYAGQSVAYTCASPCVTGSHTVAVNWNISWNWSLISSCPAGGTGDAHLTVSLVSQIYDVGTATTIASSTTTLSNPATLSFCPGFSSGGTSSPLPVTRLVSATLIAGTTYDFIGFVYSDATTSYCYPTTCGVATSADFFEASFDMAAGGASGVLNSVTLS